MRTYWTNQGIADEAWQQAVHQGLIAGQSLPPKTVSVDIDALRAAEPGQVTEGVELLFQPDPALWDGRFANNGWLQELPNPLTKLTWDNAALLSPATARELSLASEDVVEIEYAGRRVRAPVWVNPGQADNCLAISLGYGRERVGRVGNGVGFNAYALRTGAAPWIGHPQELRIRKTGQQYRLASTQTHFNMAGRHLVRSGSLARFKAEPDFVHHLGGHGVDESLSLFPAHQYEGYAWGLVVDLNACTGCGACVIACQAENNTPVVGKEQVLVGREMHWIRVDSYYQGQPEEPTLYHQPVMCQHCEQAPCEVVCPVHATVHDSEGLNLMVYNRCIGTRYCSNNCPYKVRRFNFLRYSEQDVPSLKGQKNPDVTVRSRGVMEKCSYCLQRISAARIQANNENRPLADGEVVTACQAACPTQALVFGNINDPDSRVAQLKGQPHHYGILTELGTRPRTTYLARLRNPNPELEEGNEEGH